jgi:hypothetical protein
VTCQQRTTVRHTGPKRRHYYYCHDCYDYDSTPDTTSKTTKTTAPTCSYVHTRGKKAKKRMTRPPKLPKLLPLHACMYTNVFICTHVRGRRRSVTSPPQNYCPYMHERQLFHIYTRGRHEKGQIDMATYTGSWGQIVTGRTACLRSGLTTAVLAQIMSNWESIFRRADLLA